MKALNLYPILFILLGMSNPKVSFCQEWVRTFSSTTKNVVIYEISEDYDQGYLLCANQGLSSLMKIGWVIKTDINGNVIWEKKLGIGQHQWAIIGIDRTYDGGIILAGVCDTLDTGWGDPFVVKLSACGDVQWCHVFHNGNDPDYGVKVKTLPDNSYIFLVKDWGSEDLNSTWLMHLDVNGEIIWEQKYFQNDTLVVPYYDNELSLTTDGNYFVTGTCYRPLAGQVQPYWVWPMMILADSTGEAVWETAWGHTLPFTEQVAGDGFQSIQTANGFYTSISNYHSDASYTAPCLIKTTLSGEPVFYHDLIPNTTYGKASTITKISDSVFFIGVGYEINSLSNLSVLKSDTLGNVLAEKILNHTDYIPKDAILTYDGKYLITSLDFVNNKYVFYLWKLNQNLGYDTIYNQPMVYDSLCPHPITTSTLYFNCDLAVGIPEPVSEAAKVRMRVYPNPGNEIIHVDMPQCIQKQTETEHLSVTTIFHKWYKDLEFEVFDLFGRPVYRQVVKPSEKEVLVNVSGWSSGIYFIRLSYSGTTVATEKLVVQ